MKLKTNCPEFYNDISESIRAFLEVPVIELTETDDFDINIIETQEDGQIKTTTEYNGFTGVYSATIEQTDEISIKRLKKHVVKLSVYYCLKKATGINLPWGSLTGIRPTKLLRDVKSIEILNNKYDLPLKKGELLKRIIDNQTPYYVPKEDEVDVYIGIPFCKTRCTYCSFSSTDSTKGEKLMIPYVKALIKEIEDTASLIKTLNKKVRCLYIGGGTPTALTTPLFKDMLQCTCMHFNPKMEFTVEAGRPDTIDEEKLRLIKKAGADRISINPQSMNENTLKKVGRSHSPKEIINCYKMARQIGFKTINADLIAGLPEETPDMFFYSLEEVLKLKAENITVHTLALKRGSKMSEENTVFANIKEVQQMVEGAQEILINNGYEPYYLYRQKYMTGNFENIGYAIKGHTGIYNIDIMEETTDIIALGCGGVSKRVIKEEDRLERAFNFKSIYEYIQRIDEANLRKKQLFEIN
ncbi:MAG: coproporphyrinogen dehydrogenase HemZ [Clostridiales bacterium]|nr:coproporphyrinogen dehydrogenase HemZ [Clostridiales bacterium]